MVEADNLAKWYGDRLLWDKVSFSLPRGGVVGVIGANGAPTLTVGSCLTLFGSHFPDNRYPRLTL